MQGPLHSLSPQANRQKRRERDRTHRDDDDRCDLGRIPRDARQERVRLKRFRHTRNPPSTQRRMDRGSAFACAWLASRSSPEVSGKPTASEGGPSTRFGPQLIEGRSLRAFSMGWPAMSEPGGSLRCDARRVEWRRERDSNPRPGFPGCGFQDRRLRPLGHPSAQQESGLRESGFRVESLIPDSWLLIPTSVARSLPSHP